jgi:hypothetical protein
MDDDKPVKEPVPADPAEKTNSPAKQQNEHKQTP